MKSEQVLRASVIAVLVVVTLSAQAPVPAFEVASVRRSAPGRFNANIEFPPGRFIATGVPLRWLIAEAYGADGRDPEPDRIVGGPAWVDSTPFDVQATTTDGRPASRAAIRLMLQALLEERFSLRMRAEQRNLPAYALLLDRDDGRPGPQLRPAQPKNCSELASEQATQQRCGGGVYFDQKSQVTVMYGSDVDVDGLVYQIAGPAGAALDRPVVNRTGLDGRFDYELRFSIPAGRVASAAVPDVAGTSVFTALREQLGLKLEPVDAPIEVRVIESVDPPAEN